LMRMMRRLILFNNDMNPDILRKYISDYIDSY